MKSNPNIKNIKKLEKRVESYLKCELFQSAKLNDNTNKNIDIFTKVQNLLLSGKYRKFPITDEIREMLQQRVDYILNHDKPFIFVPSFGGYKHSWTPSYPCADWAEVFNIKCFIDYLTPLYYLTEKTIIVEYLSKDIIVPMMNNIPKEFVDIYLSDFKKLISLANQKQNEINFELHSSHEDYEINTLFELMNQNRESINNKFNQLDSNEQDMKLKKSENNYCWNGVRNYEDISESEKKNVIIESRIINETFLKVDSELRGGSSKGRTNAIPMLFRKGKGACNEICLNVCSCPSSTVAFWVGIGILEIRENKIIPRILSKLQYEELKDKLIKIPVNIKELSIVNKNYEYIYVYLGEIKL